MACFSTAAQKPTRWDCSPRKCVAATPVTRQGGGEVVGELGHGWEITVDLHAVMQSRMIDFVLGQSQSMYHVSLVSLLASAHPLNPQ